jgi:predicted MFS family arabinose efflux permease
MPACCCHSPIGKLYGAQRLATLLGITFLLHQVGAFLSSWLGGVVLEAAGGYDSMWLFDLALATLAATVSLTIREPRSPASGTIRAMSSDSVLAPAR